CDQFGVDQVDAGEDRETVVREALAGGQEDVAETHLFPTRIVEEDAEDFLLERVVEVSEELALGDPERASVALLRHQPPRPTAVAGVVAVALEGEFLAQLVGGYRLELHRDRGRRTAPLSVAVVRPHRERGSPDRTVREGRRGVAVVKRLARVRG